MFELLNHLTMLALEPAALVAVIIGVIVLIIVFFSFIPLGLWISAAASGVRVGLFTLIGMKIRKVRPARIINPLIKATKAGLDLSINKMEAHYLASPSISRRPAPSTLPAATF